MLDADDFGDKFLGEEALTFYWLKSFGIRLSFSGLATSIIFYSRKLMLLKG